MTMLSINAVRAAVMSPKPWSALDQLVREQLSAGRLKNQVRDELLAMEDDLHGTPAFSEDSADALHDIIDALAGMCPAKYSYDNPPIMPSEREIKGLPRWAQIAYGIRCVRRVIPLVNVFWKTVPSDLQEAIATVLDEAETAQSNQSSEYAEELTNLARGLMDFVEEAPTVDYAQGGVSDLVDAVDDIGRAASSAIRGWMTSEYVHRATTFARSGASEVVDIAASCRHDFDHISLQTELHRWKQTDPVGLDCFGPFWPRGQPGDWATDTSSRTANILIELAKDERRTELTFVEEILNIFNALNGYHISRGGQPLTLSDLQPFVPVLVPARV